MIEERIQYGIDNFLEDNFFLPFSNSYCLEEKVRQEEANCT